MAQSLDQIKAQGILSDPQRTERLIQQLLDDVALWKNKCDTYKQENSLLLEAMKKKDEARVRRMEADLLEKQSDIILRDVNLYGIGDAPNDPYVRPIQALNGRDEDIYSIVPTANAAAATDDVCSQRLSTESIESMERTEIELHDEPPRADSSVPRLPPRPRSISQSTVYKISTTQFTQPAEKVEEQKPRDGFLSRFLRSLRRKRID